jgi:hypothetical protein
MLTLLEQQQKLRDILRGRPAGNETSGLGTTTHDTIESDPWLASVVGSPGLIIMRLTASWWQRFQIESSCRYSSRLMKRLGCFERYLAAHFATHSAPDAIEKLSTQFLASLAKHENPLLCAVAQFELFCVGSAEAPSRDIAIFWDRDPQAVLVALDQFQPLPEPVAGVRYRLQLSSTNPTNCTRESLIEE